MLDLTEALAPCGRDHQVLIGYHPKIRVIVPTPDGIRSVKIIDLMPPGFLWSAAAERQESDPIR